MKLFGWFRRDPVSRGWVPGRAVAIPHYPRVEMRSSVVENNFSADSISTLSVTLRLLQSGETAESVGSQYERLAPTGIHHTTNTPDGCQRLHCNVPNWVHLMVRQEGWVHKLHTEVPVWVNPADGKMTRIDKEKLIEELEPDRERGRHIFQVAGMMGKMDDSPVPQAASTPVPDVSEMLSEMFTGGPQANREVATMGDIDEDDPEDAFAPDLSKYPPIHGVDFYKWVEVTVELVRERVPPAEHDEFAQSEGVPAGRWLEIDKNWKQRMSSDWKLGTLYGSEYEALMREG